MSDTATVDQQTGDTAEQSTDQAGAPESGVTSEATTTTTEQHEEPESEVESIELLGQEQYDALKGDPGKLRKELNRAATQKFQEIARYRDVLEPYAEFIQALEDNPTEAALALVQRLGIEVPQRARTETQQEQAVADISTRVTEAIRQSLGAEYSDLADRFAPGIIQAVELVVGEHTAPLRQSQEQVIQESAMREAADAIKGFAKNYPDWQKYEKDMVTLSKVLQPNGMDQEQYLGVLYREVSRAGNEGKTVRQVIERMKKAATNEGKSTTVAAKVVSNRPVGTPSFSEAYEAAKRGERLE